MSTPCPPGSPNGDGDPPPPLMPTEINASPEAPTVPGAPIPVAGAPACLGPYLIEKELGRGGMGVVYRALDTRLNRRVAVKTLAGIARYDDTGVRRFRQEVETASKLKHPNIITIYEVGWAQVPGLSGTPEPLAYYAMELLHGESLDRILWETGTGAGGRGLPARVAARVVRDVALGLVHAHEHGVVHRDLKPQNIMIEVLADAGPQPRPAPSPGAPTAVSNEWETAIPFPAGKTVSQYRVVLTDFGLARDVSASTRLTGSGEFLGTPAYVSPEQAGGDMDHVDALSDVYSLGAVLYELLTGSPPVDGDTAAAILVKVMCEDPVPPRRRRPSIHVDLETLCLKAMQRQRHHRYPSMHAFLLDLNRFLAGEPISARAPGWRERAWRRMRRRPALLAAGTALLIAALAWGSWTAGSALYRSRLLTGHRREASERLQRGDYAGVLEEVARGLRLAPADPDLERLRDSARVELLLLECDGQLAQARELLDQADGEAQEAVELGKGVKDWDPIAVKRVVWEKEREAREHRQRADGLRSQAVQTIATGLRLIPGYSRARSRWCELWFQEFLDAESGGDAESMREARRQVELYDDERAYAARFDEGSLLSFESSPAGAEVFLFRYEEHLRLLTPCPYDAIRGLSLSPPDPEPVPSAPEEARLQAGFRLSLLREASVGTTPCSLDLPKGSYLALIRRDGFEGARFPFVVTRAPQKAVGGDLKRREDYPRCPPGAWTQDPTQYWCYVPAGEFRMGFEPISENVIDDAHRFVGSFFVSRCEVTQGEWLSFLRSSESKEAIADAKPAVVRIPRLQPNGGALWVADETGDYWIVSGSLQNPIADISWKDAQAYVDWLTREGVPGAGRETSLIGDAEWEKAARGADGRSYPWGSLFDWSFCQGAYSQGEGSHSLREVGSFPLDESPYGVRDMAGSLSEWCRDPFEGQGGMRVFRGGGFQQNIHAYRLAARPFGGEGAVGPYLGLRIVVTEPASK